MTAQIVPLKHLAGINERALPEDTDPDRQLRYIDIGAVGRGELVADPEELRFEDAPSRARRLVRVGDTIVSTVRTYLRAVWPVSGDTDRLVVSTGFAVLTPRTIDPRYFSWWARSDGFIEEVVARSVGVSYPAINALELGELLIRVPRPAEQRAIADFLDTETARIDALITKKRRTIRLLDQRRWISFLSRVAATGAQRVPLRRALRFITDGPFGSAFTSGEYTELGIAVIRLGNIGFAEFRGSELAHLADERFAEFRRYQVREGDVLFAGLGDERNHAGRACVAPDLGEAIVKGKCFCARLDLTRAEPDYVALYFSSPAAAESVAVEARGSTRSMINLEIVKSVELPLPSVGVQQAVAAQTRREWARVRELSERMSVQIALLEEHRQALITAAVTGELDIPGTAA